MRTDQRTKDYVARRVAEGHSKLEIIRGLKRFVTREMNYLLKPPNQANATPSAG